MRGANVSPPSCDEAALDAGLPTGHGEPGCGDRVASRRKGRTVHRTGVDLQPSFEKNARRWSSLLRPYQRRCRGNSGIGPVAVGAEKALDMFTSRGLAAIADFRRRAAIPAPGFHRSGTPRSEGSWRPAQHCMPSCMSTLRLAAIQPHHTHALVGRGEGHEAVLGLDAVGVDEERLAPGPPGIPEIRAFTL